MESRSIKIKSAQNSKLSIDIIPGHFATSHSHVNYYVDMTKIKHRIAMAQEAAATLAANYSGTPVDTIVCLEGCETVGALLARELTSAGYVSMNEKKELCVVTPEFVPGGQLIFRDNIQPMLWNKSVLLLLSSVTTGKTVKRALECIRYYGGNVAAVSSIFSAINQVGEIPIHSIFNADDLPGYQTYSLKECPECAKQHKIDAMINSYGYSRV
ncbi:MAG: orotate phosphoribosyltransferase [Acutalibacteraceae bacterium]|jgi:orotate phosphoribosyltransferase